MRIRLRENISRIKPSFDTNLLVPLAIILTLISIVNSLQAFFIFYKGDLTLLNFARTLISKIIYFLYFIVPAIFVNLILIKIKFSRKTLIKWLLTHIISLVIFYILHQSIVHTADSIIWGAEYKSTYFDLLLNNPLIWIDIIAYVFFILGFYSLEYKRINQENEIKFAQLEVKLIQSKLQELRSRIHPSFIFKTLNSILDLINQDRFKDANKILSLLSDFLRTTVYDNERDQITFEEEIRFLKSYIDIENVRLENRIIYRERIDKSVIHAYVPNFFIQPIVEEFLEKISLNEISKYEVQITAEKIINDLSITISVSSSPGSVNVGINQIEGAAITIMKERLDQIYAGSQNIKQITGHDDKFEIIIRIPLIENIIQPEPAFT